MARDSYSAQQAKIEREIGKLQKKAEALQARRRSPVIDSIVASMTEYDISLEELTQALKKRRPTAAAKKAQKTASANKPTRVVSPKYRHPTTGETWTGRGKLPRWLSQAEAEGATRESFLIN